tara:strand:+ start:255 stop:704 length:450 start_codon:yes stop_codon:yes gene_type:complete
MTKDTFNKVESILRAYPETRESDIKLAFQFYSQTINGFYARNKPIMNVLDFFKLLELKEATKMSSICRARRKIQVSFVELRGKNWKRRHKHQKVIVKTVNKWEGERNHEVNIIYQDQKLPKGEKSSEYNVGGKLIDINEKKEETNENIR